MEGLLKAGIAFAVAPREADSALAALSRQGVVKYVIVKSSDADMLAYSGLDNIIFHPFVKLPTPSRPTHKFFGTLVQRSLLFVRRTVPQFPGVGEVRFDLWNDELLVCLAAMLGCDYGTVKGFGPVKTLDLLDKVARSAQLGLLMCLMHSQRRRCVCRGRRGRRGAGVH